MFDDEEEDEEVGMEEGESSQVDTEADIDVTDIGGEVPQEKVSSPHRAAATLGPVHRECSWDLPLGNLQWRQCIPVQEAETEGI